MDGEQAFFHFLSYVGRVHARVCGLLARMVDRQAAKDKTVSESQPEGESREESEKSDHTT